MSILQRISAAWAVLCAPRVAAMAPAALHPDTPVEEFDNEARARRGKRAEALLTDPLINEAFQTLERAYIAAWLATRSDDEAARERLWAAMAVLRTVRDHLRAVASGGALLQGEVRALQRRSATAFAADPSPDR